MKLLLLLTVMLAAHAMSYMEEKPKVAGLEKTSEYLTGGRLVRVGVAPGSREAALRSASGLEVTANAGQPALRVPAGTELRVRSYRGGSLVCQAGTERQRVRAEKLAIRPSEPGCPIEVLSDGSGSGKWLCYPGLMEVRAEASGLRLINEVGLEEYVAGVVAREMPASFHPEALKAQAIVIRSYTLHNLGRHAAEGFDLCGEVHCQVYRGLAEPGGPAARAARETAGLVLMRNGSLVNAVYHSTCGGMTEGEEGVGGADDRIGEDRGNLGEERDLYQFVAEPPRAWCEKSPRYRWEVSLSYEEANELVSKNLGQLVGKPGLAVGQLQSLLIKRRGERGRVEEFEVRAGGRSHLVYGDQARWLFGEGKPSVKGLPSTLFAMEVEFEGGWLPARFIFRGGGWGHGRGLCQWGAQGRATAGASAEEIVKAYYPGAEIARGKAELTGE